MLVCGKEEPLHVNKQLHMRDEETGEMNLSDLINARLNRYSFVWLGRRDDADAALSRCMQAIIDDGQIKANWLLIWGHQEQGYGKFRSLWRVSRRRKEGWAIYHDDKIGLASKPITAFPDGTYRPLGYDRHDGNVALLLGDDVPLDALATGPARPSLERAGDIWELCPSERLLTWLADRGVSIAYGADSAHYFTGIVLIGPLRVNTDHLRSWGICRKVWENDDADKAWRYSSSAIDYTTEMIAMGRPFV